MISLHRAIETTDDIHGRRFAGARCPHDGDEFAFLDRQRGATQRVDLNIAHGVRLMDVLQLNHRGSLGQFDHSRDCRVRFYDFSNCLHDFLSFVPFRVFSWIQFFVEKNDPRNDTKRAKQQH